MGLGEKRNWKVNPILILDLVLALALIKGIGKVSQPVI